MIELYDDFSGGRKPANDDLRALQYQASALASILPSAFVVSGCAISPAGGSVYDIASGVVVIGGKLREFAGATGVDLATGGGKVLAAASPQLVGSRTFTEIGGGTVKPALVQNTLTILDFNGAPSGSLVIRADGMRTVREAVRDMSIPIGAVQFLDLAVGFIIDADSKGIGDYRGWAFANGLNGTYDLRNHFMLGAGLSFNWRDTDDVSSDATTSPLFPVVAMSPMIYLGCSTSDFLAP